MLANSRYHKQAQRGIVLVLVLAMLGLLALIGVTFATFSGQAKINTKNYFQGVLAPQDDELMDFALSQLITDTGDAHSAIHGHSLARDMYGSDANNNGYMPFHPTYGGPFYITGITLVGGSIYQITTNIQQNDPNFYGVNFRRWIMKVSYTGTTTAPSVNSPYQPPSANGATATSYSTVSLNTNQPASQTFEIIADSGFNSTSNAARGFNIVLNDAATNLINWGYMIPASVSGVAGGSAVAAAASQLPGQYLYHVAANNLNPGLAFPFSLDGRWLHAFNGTGMGANATHGNFRYNGLSGNYLTGTSAGMDEDYDACDLENWFLAIQSADGQVVIPSFHRPGILRHDLVNGADDWNVNYRFPNGLLLPPNTDSLSRILRPVAADGNDAATFKDLVPDPGTGKITYDVDNDGDGVTDSVWLDLGYPSRRDSRGQLTKPLFAFMVIGLNGRIPLNTAGNLASQNSANSNLTAGYSHTEHFGNSVSEIDPTYALQNAYQGQVSDFDPFNSLITAPNTTASTYWNGPLTMIQGTTVPTNNTQVDNAVNQQGNYESQDVRLTQLRNLLAGTRPQTNPLSAANGSINGDANLIFGAFGGSASGQSYVFPNSIADYPITLQNGTVLGDIPSSFTDPAGNILVQRTTAPVGGRWGEAASVSGVPFVNPATGTGTPLNLVQINYANPVRAGYSFDITDLLNAITAGTAYDGNGDPIFPRDAADDNYNAFDVFPPRLTGEQGDFDYFDATGSLLLPVERFRRFVTPMDINGSGRVSQFNNSASNGRIGRGQNLGPDNFGRVQFSSYYRPGGAPGVIGTNYHYDTATTPPSYTAVSGSLGAIYYPESTPPASPAATSPAPPAPPYNAASSDPFYASGPNIGVATNGTNQTSPVYWPTYLPDRTNNPFHGFESYKLPNLMQSPGTATTYASYNNFNPQQIGGMPVDQNPLVVGATTVNNVPAAFPTYDNKVNSSHKSDGENEADEMNLYAPNPLLDSPFEISDLEWLYRQQDIDGASLTSRLSQLAPISFTNAIDGSRRRRLFSLDAWETNNFVWANDNPGNAFPYNSRFTNVQNASLANLTGRNVLNYTPSLAQRDKKINLNYPLPVSNDCNEPVRQKWIRETYQLLKFILPPDSVDTAEELAQLSQFVINIIDFRDPDATMTHWVNPDVVFTASTATNAYPTLTINYNNGNLDQFGMEYNPVAINEVLAYSFQTRQASPNVTATESGRFFIELVNTLTAAYNANFNNTTPTDPNNYYANQASSLNLGGFNYASTASLSDPYGGGCWDLVFTADNGASRPDPFSGQLAYSTVSNYYGLIPLHRDSFYALGTLPPLVAPTATTPLNNGDPTLIPVSPNPPGTANLPTTIPVQLPTTQTNPPTNYFYVLSDPSPGNESSSLSPTSTSTPTPQQGTQVGPPVTQQLQAAYDPITGATSTFNAGGTITNTTPLASSNPSILWRLGILPGMTAGATDGTAATQPTNFGWKLPTPLPSFSSVGSAQYYWVCLRRPANPFAPVSATNPMVVVNSMRFPFIDGSGSSWNYDSVNKAWQVTSTANTIYSAQRLQPYRGGQAVPPPYLTGTGPTQTPPDSRYGYTEQICFPELPTYRFNNYAYSTIGSTKYPLTNNIVLHTLGQPNSAAENWDYLVFNDRDFSSVAELMLVPGCPPGLFTKQFVEFAPSQINAFNIFSQVTPTITPLFTSTSTVATTAKDPTLFNSGTFGFGSMTGPGATAPFMSVSAASSPTALVFPGTPPTSAYTSVTAGVSQNSITTVPSFPSSLASTSLPSTVPTPVQPHTYPYLVNKFFYTGASSFLYPPLVYPNTSNGVEALTTQGGAGTTDPSSSSSQPVVGGPGADGWFKMFDFFEVPSQMTGAIGPVAQGANFDWARQDSKPGLMNVNLIIDEEAFFAVFGRQNSSFTQTLLNGIELPPWPQALTASR